MTYYDQEYRRPSGGLGCSFGYFQGKLALRRTVQVRLGSNPAVPWDGCPARGASACAARGTPIFMTRPQQFMKHLD
jgi:hypothetical protein